jgi:hypothetical protein
VESASADELLASVNATRRAEGQLIFTMAEVRFLLQMMDAEKVIMFQDDMAFNV